MHSFKGNILLAINECENAISSFNMALKYKENYLTEIKMSPNFKDAPNSVLTNFYNASIGSIFYSLAECKVYLGNFDDALVNINIALDLMPDLENFNK